VVQQPATALALFASAAAARSVLETVVTALFIALRSLVEPALTSPVAWLAALAALALTGVWLYLMRTVLPEGRLR
jgi:hypothetical protein